MKPLCHVSVSLALTLLLSPVAHAQSLNQTKGRLSDKSISADYASFERQQAAIKTLNDSGKQPVNSASLAKAQCWLDVSFHEYSRNDRSAFPVQALEQSVRITDYLSGGGDPGDAGNPAANTPLVNNAARLREDLWAQAQSIRSGPGGRCAENQLACVQVELVHAGNEHNQLGWRHAKPYVQLAEDKLARAKAAASQCTPIVTKPVQKPVTMAPPAPIQELSLMSTVLFNFDRDSMSQARRLTVEHLNTLIARITSSELLVSEIRVTGHADKTQHATQRDYNQGLSLRRANAVVDHMVSAGVASDLISIDARSDSEPARQCSTAGTTRAEIIECLLPNRRVEVLVTATRPAP